MSSFLLLLTAIGFIVVATGWLKVHPILTLLLASFGYGLAVGLPLADLPLVISGGFGATIGAVGPIILLGAIIGVFLERSGGALHLAEGLLRFVGRRNVPAAMGGAGFVVSIPVFCDSGFIILNPLNRALSRAAGVAATAGAIALALGLYAAHTMVPPTPGPVAAAELVGADLGLVLTIGLPVALITASAGIAYAWFAGSGVEPDGERPSLPEAPEAKPQTKRPPSVWLALLPLIVPIFLILLGSLAGLGDEDAAEAQSSLLSVLGHPIIALAIGALFALFLPRPFKLEMLSSDGWVGQAFRDCAMIILITGAGGAFGSVLRESALVDLISQNSTQAQIGILAPILIAAAIKSAQGSSTVAIVTTASLMTPLLPVFGLDSESGKALTVVAIGAGAMAVSHVNDSFFWVVTRLTGLSVIQGLKLQSAGTAIQAVVAAISLFVLQIFVLGTG